MSNANLDLMNTAKLVELFLSEEQRTILVLKKQKANITKAVDTITSKIKKGGRVIYIGAGTSGRLGILDASECSPTFNTDLFLGIIAGGKAAMFKAKEGSEDNKNQAIKDLRKIKITWKDLLVGLSASGETPYTVSAIKFAKKLKVPTIAITSNPSSTLSKTADINISPEIKKEIISGSTRLRSGTAQKIILNILSSVSMIKDGKIYGDLMIDVQPTNKKLANRAIGIISTVCKVPFNKAKTLFLKARNNTKAAIIMHFHKCNLQAAKSLLKKSNSDLRKIIG